MPIPLQNKTTINLQIEFLFLCSEEAPNVYYFSQSNGIIHLYELVQCYPTKTIAYNIGHYSLSTLSIKPNSDHLIPLTIKNKPKILQLFIEYYLQTRNYNSNTNANTNNNLPNLPSLNGSHTQWNAMFGEFYGVDCIGMSYYNPSRERISQLSQKNVSFNTEKSSPIHKLTHTLNNRMRYTKLSQTKYRQILTQSELNHENDKILQIERLIIANKPIQAFEILKSMNGNAYFMNICYIRILQNQFKTGTSPSNKQKILMAIMEKAHSLLLNPCDPLLCSIIGDVIFNYRCNNDSQITDENLLYARRLIMCGSVYVFEHKTSIETINHLFGVLKCNLLLLKLNEMEPMHFKSEIIELITAHINDIYYYFYANNNHKKFEKYSIYAVYFIRESYKRWHATQQRLQMKSEKLNNNNISQKMIEILSEKMSKNRPNMSVLAQNLNIPNRTQMGRIRRQHKKNLNSRRRISIVRDIRDMSESSSESESESDSENEVIIKKEKECAIKVSVKVAKTVLRDKCGKCGRRRDGGTYKIGDKAWQKHLNGNHCYKCEYCSLAFCTTLKLRSHQKDKHCIDSDSD